MKSIKKNMEYQIVYGLNKDTTYYKKYAIKYKKNPGILNWFPKWEFVRYPLSCCTKTGYVIKSEILTFDTEEKAEEWYKEYVLGNKDTDEIIKRLNSKNDKKI